MKRVVLDHVGRTALLGAVLGAISAGPVLAQARPFLFTVTTTAPSEHDRWTVQYGAGYGQRTDQPFGYDGVEQRVGVQGALGRGFTLFAQAGLGLADGIRANTSQEIELLKDLRPASAGLGVSVGLGVRREWEGASVLLGRVSLGRRFSGSSLFGSVRFERALATGRDGVDVVTTVGWLHRLGAGLHLGLEGVGEDLEGLWEAEEAEGGARLFVGPSVHFAPAGRPWSASLCGGPVLQATRSGRVSPASRPLGAAGENGYTVRLSVSYAF